MADSTRFRDPRDLRAEAARLLATATAIEDGTWAIVVDGPGTAEALAAAIGCSTQAANNRLRKLYDLRIVDREQVIPGGGGRHYVYRIALQPAA